MIIFNISNSQNDYAKCLQVINYLKDNSKPFAFSNPIEIAFYNEYTNNYANYKYIKQCIIYSVEKKWPDIEKMSINDSSDLILQIMTESYDNCFYFRVNSSTGSDCVNFSYFELIADILDDYYLGIVLNDNSDIYRISSFYSALNTPLISNFYNRRLFIQSSLTNEIKIKRFNLKGNYASRTYFPLLKININVYKVLNKSTINFFNFENQSTNNKIEKCIMEFCQKLYRELDSKVQNKMLDIKNKVEQLSYLALAYLLSFLYYTDNKDISKNKIISLLVDAEDFAEGTLQIIENAYLHANNGYFCFRIHKKENKQQYFNEYYHNLPNIIDNSIYKEYIEILVSDFNTKYDIPHKFLTNLKENSIADETIKQFEGLELQDIFDYYGKKKSQWQEYYRIPKNISLHYGLLSFEQIVNRANGYFLLTSSTANIVKNNNIYFKSPNGIITNYKNNENHIPGSQYRILLPIKYENENIPTGLKANLSLKDESIENICIIKIDAKKIMGKVDSKDKKNRLKNNFISSFVDILYREINLKITTQNNTCTENIVLSIDAQKIIKPNESEVLTKSLIWLVNMEDFKINKIGINNVSHTLFSIFIRMFGILYYKAENCECMKNKQVFLCDEECQTEIEFYGNKIINAVSISNYLSNSKGEYPVELSILEHISKKCNEEIYDQNIEAFPFDVILPEENHTLFEKRVYCDLNRDIQSNAFGCRLNNVHMQVGSKIHITDSFYEATLLFEISNYVTRFSYILAKKINREFLKNSKDQSKNRPIILIGYETYSEMLMVHTKRTLETHFGFKNISYIIYEERNISNPFRHWENEVYDALYITIVPIGSTLTTHNKIEADILRKNPNANFLMNLCVILIRNSNGFPNEFGVKEIESTFWASVNDIEKIVTMQKLYSLKSNNQVNYICCVENSWSQQKTCKLCYPEDNQLITEQPILKVNKASVVPMTMIGLNEPDELTHIHNYSSGFRSIKSLKKALLYGHYQRGDNHFEYYFRNDKLFDNIINTEKVQFDKWISTINSTNDEITDGVIKYDFLVAPLHKTNAAFVEYINQKAFGMAKMVLWIDVKREFRDNIKTKYSNLSQLINNLIDANKKAEINFHYIDDTITTGYSFERIKNLIDTLFVNEIKRKDSNITINLFASVILLLNRCSYNTKRKYIDDTSKYYSYISLNISAMRHHDDACSQCKKFTDYNNLMSLSATNRLAEFFDNQKAQKQIMPIYISNNDIASCNNRDYYRMYYTHEINTQMIKLGNKKNDKNTVFSLLKNLMLKCCSSKNTNLNFDKISIILEVMSSPFIEYRFSVQLASFNMLIRLANSLLFQERDDSVDDILNIIQKNCTKNNISLLLKTIFSQLSYMGANYILRNNVIEKFFEYIEKNELNNTNEDWIKFYCILIKQSLYFNNQGSRCIKFDEILTNNFFDSKNTPITLSKIKDLAYIENNFIINNTLNEITKEINKQNNKSNDNKMLIGPNTSIQNAINITNDLEKNQKINDYVTDILHQYYCNDYIEFNQTDVKEINANSKITNIMAALTLSRLLLMPNGDATKTKDSKDYYRTLLNQLSKVLEIDNDLGLQLFTVTSKTEDKNSDSQIVFINSSQKNINEGDILFLNSIKRIIANSEDINNIGDTYYYVKYEEFQTNFIKISKPDNTKKDSNTNCSNVFWCFAFQSGKIDIELFKRIRNFLILREALLLRLTKDFDNNLFDEYTELKYRVSKLSNQKAGSHTPFEELRTAFFKIKNALSEDKYITDENKRIYTESIKIIADSLISKWYVFSLTDTIPKNMSLNIKPQFDKISSYWNLLKLCDSLIIDEPQGAIIPKIKWDKSFNKSIKLQFPSKSSFIWCCAFFSIIINALRHGYNEDLDSDLNCDHITVNINVSVQKKSNNSYIEITNLCKTKNQVVKQEQGITLTALQYFFDMYYGKNQFSYTEDKKNNLFIVKMPCKCIINEHKKENKKEDEKGN